MRPQVESLPGESDSLSVAQLADYVQRQLQSLAASVSGLYDGEGEVSNRAPQRPREGLYAWADGTNWNPAGVGKGPVVYDGSAYRALYSTPAALLTAIKTVDGAGSGLDSDTLDALESSYFLNAGNLSAGTLLAARMPALTGDVTTTAGSVATTIGANKVTLAMLATMATGNVLGRNTSGTGNVETLAFAEANTASTLAKRDANGRLAAVGLFFPATQSASTDVNCLDDYEEGTWTPTVAAGSGSFTTVSAVGTYTKIGRVVIIDVRVTITTNGTAATLVQASLPFTSAGSNYAVGAGRETSATGTMLQNIIYATDTNTAILNYNNTYPGASGYVLVVSNTYRV